MARLRAVRKLARRIDASHGAGTARREAISILFLLPGFFAELLILTLIFGERP